MSLVDSLSPQGAWLLIRPDKRSSVIGSVLLPENVIDQVRARSGKVLKAGAGARGLYWPKYDEDGKASYQRVLYNVNAATTAGIDEVGQLDLLPDGEVMALTDGEEDGECDEEWIKHLVAPPGMMLVERDEKREMIGNIVVPESYKRQVRSARAKVLKSKSPLYVEGDWILLSAGASRSFTMDARSTRQIVRCTPGQVLCRVQGELEGAVSLEANLGGIREELIAQSDFDPRFDAGDMRAPR